MWVFVKHFASPLLSISGRKRDFPVALRKAMEELGLTYLKLGQFLAMRFDILPPALCRELSLLFENVAPMPYAQAKAVLESELQSPLENLFAEFDSQPIAAASVGQVHVARLHDGNKVAVKVQRIGIERLFESDMRILNRVAALADRFNLLGGVFSAVDTVREFSHWTRSELNFELEGRVADRLHSDVGAMAVVPTVHWHLTKKRVLTTDFVDGLTLAKVLNILEHEGLDVLRERVPGIDLALFGKNLVRTVLHQLFITGFFHGDPHPGNLIICADNRVGLIDFGIFGELNREQRNVLSRQIETISVGDVDGCFECVAKQYYPGEETDVIAFESEVKTLLRKWYEASIDPNAPLKDKHVGNHSSEVMDAARRYGLRGGTATLLFWRSLYVLDATALKIRDYLNLLQEMDNFFQRYRPTLSRRLSELVNDTWQSMPAWFLQTIPHYIRGIGLESNGDDESIQLNERVTESRASGKQRNKRTDVLLFPFMAFTGIYLAIGPSMFAFQGIIATIPGLMLGIFWLRRWSQPT